MNPGSLRHRVSIQRYTDYEDEFGVSKGQWTDLKTVWCSVSNLYGKEYWSAKEYSAENTVEFTIRCSSCKDISVKDRLVFCGKLYNISSVNNVLYRGDCMKIKAMEVL